MYIYKEQSSKVSLGLGFFRKARELGLDGILKRGMGISRVRVDFIDFKRFGLYRTYIRLCRYLYSYLYYPRS